jgi:membrane protein implicated in regulation of membrane protease activity
MEEFIGKTARALASIPGGGEGKVEFKGAHWSAISTDEVSAGESVVITAREGLSLRVAKRST